MLETLALACLLCFSELPDTMAQFDAQLTRLTKPGHDYDPNVLKDWLQNLAHNRKVPFIQDQQVVFLYLEDEADGRLSQVTWPGDWNGWQPGDEDRGQRCGETGLWILRKQFPRDARLDYKILLNGRQWILDPYNHRKQVGGYGPNNVLAMPAYKPSDWVIADPKSPGQLQERRLYSNLLGYEVAYQVYLPANSKPETRYHTLYFSDGSDYADPRMGGAVRVLDNLIAAVEIGPVMAVFIDPRDVRSKDNRRIAEYGHHYALTGRFLRDELIPAIDSQYPTKAQASHRSIIGTSLGGLLASYVVLKQGDVFGSAGIHSPAFWFDGHHHGRSSQDSPVMQMWREAPVERTIYLTVGSIGDLLQGSRRFQTVIANYPGQVIYEEVADGHSWGNWRDRMATTIKSLVASSK